jgi:hypothetical protein
MRGLLKVTVMGFAVGICLADYSPLAAHESRNRPGVDDDRDASSYYPAPTPRPEPRAIIHAKAQARAYERQSRLASMSWYGMSNSRPIATTTPFTSRYSPLWEMPGGRPYSWHAGSWPTYVLYTR